MTSRSPVEYAGLVVDLCAESDAVEEYDVEIRDNAVVRARPHKKPGAAPTGVGGPPVLP